ncbi:MAG: hypothetical protein JNJ77_05880 [Planctomycetia bacterium]|nr:hypothetical protein [Planctomycetia bacterium]
MSDEHIFPEKLGGRRVLKNKVCRECNNGVLSGLDTQLITHSPLSIIAFRELKTGLPDTWEINEHDGKTLISAQPVINESGFEAMRVWPQIMLENGKLSIYGTEREMREYGAQEFNRKVVEHTKRVLKHRACGAISIIDEQHSQYDFHESCEYPPRLYLPCILRELKRSSKMILSYVSEEDKFRLLYALEKMPSDHTFNTSVTIPGSKSPLIVRSWYPDILVRALGKIGFNLLSHLCTKTLINRFTYPAIDYITGVRRRKYPVVPPFGFVPPHFAEEIKHPNKGHAARVVYSDKSWTILFSFFGNALAAIIQIPGHSSEEWYSADVSMDLNRKRSWTESKTKLLLQARGIVEWEDVNRICPSLKIIGSTRKTSIEAVRIVPKGSRKKV